MATVTCKCGKIKLGFPASKDPRVHTVCCCDDCQRRVQYLADQGGTPIDHSQGIEVANFEAQIKVEYGLDQLLVYKLRNETNLINVASKCCHSFLCARNTDFHGNAIATLPQFANVDSTHPTKPLQFLSYRKFWPAEIKVPDGIPEFWKTEDGAGFDGTQGFMQAIETTLGSNAAPLSEPIDGTVSFDGLIEGQPILLI